MTAKTADVLWDDDGFKQRVEAACKLRGVSVREALMGAGASRYYLNKQVEGRSTNTVMKLARELDVPPADLMFGVEGGGLSIVEAKAATTNYDALAEEAEALRRVMAQMFTAEQVWALMCLAVNQKKARREAVTELMFKAAHGGSRDAEAQSSGTDEPEAAPSDAPGSASNIASSSERDGIEA